MVGRLLSDLNHSETRPMAGTLEVISYMVVERGNDLNYYEREMHHY